MSCPPSRTTRQSGSSLMLKGQTQGGRIVGLTGTPASTALMDLWAEFRILDMGQRLGRFITKYRTDYFAPDKRNGQIIYSYKPLPYAGGRYLPADFGYHHFYEVRRPPADAGTGQQRIHGSRSPRMNGKIHGLETGAGAVAGRRRSPPPTPPPSPGNSPRWRTAQSTMTAVRAFAFTTASLTHWRISSKPPTGNLFGGVLVQA